MAIGVEVMNAALLPIVLGFLFLLAVRALPDAYRLRGIYKWVVGAVMGVTALVGVCAAIYGAFVGG